MCGRFTRTFTWRQVHDFLNLVFDMARLKEEMSYNVAPTQDSPVCRWSQSGGRELAPMRWGLVPFWAKDPSIGSKMINARSEGIEGKPAFRAAVRKRRCLVPVSGFYEWEARAGSKIKTPWYIYPADRGIMCFAGLWEHWEKPEGVLDTFTIITTGANEFMKRVHDRMPAILQPEEFERWLNPQTRLEDAIEMLRPAPDGFLDSHTVSTRVNRPANNDPSLIERASDGLF